MRLIIFLVSFLVLIVFGGMCSVKYVQFNMNVTDYLERASNSNTVETAKKELDIALKYLENNNLTSGYTSVLYRTPDEDIGFWYSNLKEASDELGKVNNKTSALERSNLLLKLRETITNAGQNGNYVIKPQGIEIYPYNFLLNLFVWTSVVILIITVVSWCVDYEPKI